MPPDNNSPASPASHDPDLARRALDLKIGAGLSNEEIAADLGISTATASRLLANAERLLSRPPHEVKVRELVDLEWMENELRREWMRSCQAKTTTTITDEDSDKHGHKIGEVTKTEVQYGDPALLRVLLMAKQRRAALLGLDAPKKVHIVEEHRQQVVALLFPALIEWCQSANIPPEQIDALAERLEQVAAGELPAPEGMPK